MRDSTEIFRRLRALKLIAGLTLAAGSNAAELTVTVANIGQADGQLMIAVQDSALAFNGERPAVVSVILPAKPGSVSFTTNALAPGEYAVRVMHDENGNGELDSNLVGMPTEPWGFSNNATGAFGPPDWNAVKFTLEDVSATVVNLNQ